MMGDEQFRARVVAGHSSQKHSRPLFRTPLIAEDPGCAGPGTELQWYVRSTRENAVSELSRRCAGHVLRPIFSESTGRLQGKLLGVCAEECFVGWLTKDLSLFFAGADRREDGEKVESAKESGTESSHAGGGQVTGD